MIKIHEYAWISTQKVHIYTLIMTWIASKSQDQWMKCNMFVVMSANMPISLRHEHVLQHGCARRCAYDFVLLCILIHPTHVPRIERIHRCLPFCVSSFTETNSTGSHICYWCNQNGAPDSMQHHLHDVELVPLNTYGFCSVWLRIQR